MRRPREHVSGLAVAIVMGSIATAAWVPAAVADGGVPTTTTITDISPASPQAFQPINFTVTVVQEAPAGGTLGTVDFYDVSTTPATHLGWTSGITGVNLPMHLYFAAGLPVGAHSIEARFMSTSVVYDSSTSSDVALAVTKLDPIIGVQGPPDPVEAHHTFQISGNMGGQTTWTSANGSLGLWRVGAAAAECTFAGFPASGACMVGPLPVGTYIFVSRYTGNDQVLAKESDSVTVNVVPDVVHATGVSLQYTTFYPYKDGFQDTVAIKGVRNEPISVTMRIYSPGGTLLKTVSIGTGTGAYSYAWNGRNSAGTWYAEGKYKVVQTLRDSTGTTLTSTLYTTLSKKRMYTYNKTIVKLGSSVTAKGTAGTGTLSFNTTSGYALLKAGSAGWAGVGWEYTLPGATIYKSFKFQVDAKAGVIGGSSHIGMQNFSMCAYSASTAWNTSCFDRWATVGNSTGTTAWYTSYGSLTTNRTGTRVRGTLSVDLLYAYVYRAQLIVSYGILKY